MQGRRKEVRRKGILVEVGFMHPSLIATLYKTATYV